MERKAGLLTSGAFAALCGTTKETLRHYKDEGLLVPVHQGENGYFYYSPEQFYDFYAISIFRQTGTSLEEIRRCLRQQDREQTLCLLREQQNRLKAERQKLEQMEFVLSETVRSLEWCYAPDMEPQTAWFETEHLLVLPAEELEGRMPPEADEDERMRMVLEQCRTLCRRYSLHTDFQLGAIHDPANLEAISHLYTRVKEPGGFPYYQEKPAGQYVYLCCQGRWDLSGGYDALKRHIQRQKLKTAGKVYACDLAGFLLNGLEKNAASMISVRLLE